MCIVLVSHMTSDNKLLHAALKTISMELLHSTPKSHSATSHHFQHTLCLSYSLPLHLTVASLMKNNECLPNSGTQWMWSPCSTIIVLYGSDLVAKQQCGCSYFVRSTLILWGQCMGEHVAYTVKSNSSWSLILAYILIWIIKDVTHHMSKQRHKIFGLTLFRVLRRQRKFFYQVTPLVAEDVQA